MKRSGTKWVISISGLSAILSDMVADYIKETDNHVAYRITPVYEGNNLVCSGVQMESFSIEDNGEICFNIYCYNVQPGITINYATGDSSGPASEQISKSSQPEESVETPSNDNVSKMVWIPRTGSKFNSHSGCSNMKNPILATKNEAISRGYEPCKKCY